MMTDSIILSGIGGLLLLLISISGFFIKRWMDTTEAREDRGNLLTEKTNESLTKLNETMNIININLIGFQERTEANVLHIKDKIETHKGIYIKDKLVVDKKLEDHESDIQDHSVRIKVLETK